MPGLFAQWQPRYAEHGLPTFPVHEKRPAVRGYLKIGLTASEQFAVRFPTANSFGIACKRSRITVLDVDTPDERLLADALSEFGPTPFIVQSGGGNWQAWYRHGGEKRSVRPDPHRPIDILGDGYVIAPPSETPRGRYRLVEGSLDDLDSLPPMRRRAAPQELAAAVPQAQVDVGRRNQELWRACMVRARECRDVTELMRSAVEMNQSMNYVPLPDEEVLRVVASAWSREISGQNWFGSGGKVVVDAAEVDELLTRDPGLRRQAPRLRAALRGAAAAKGNPVSRAISRPHAQSPRRNRRRALLTEVLFAQYVAVAELDIFRMLRDAGIVESESSHRSPTTH